jgi:hypothetical protein
MDKKKGYREYYDYYVAKDHIFRAFIFGFEAAFLADILCLGALLINPHLATTSIHFETAPLLFRMEIIFVLFILTFIYEKLIWRPQFKAVLKPILTEYEKVTKQPDYIDPPSDYVN